MSVFISNPITTASMSRINTLQTTCRKYKGFLPNVNPIIYTLSQNSSNVGLYTVVAITGQNFTPYGTNVNFGSYKNLPTIYYSAFNVSFIVPMNALIGNYNVQVITNNNNNYNPGLLYSNIVNYTIM